MAADLRLQVIRRTVLELVRFEGEVAGILERAQNCPPNTPMLAAIQRLRPMVQRHRDQLATYGGTLGSSQSFLIFLIRVSYQRIGDACHFVVRMARLAPE